MPPWSPGLGTPPGPHHHEASIAELKASDFRTAKGYALEENLRRCWHHRLERTARAHFKSWIRWAKRSALSPFTKVANMIDSRLEDIVSYFRHPITNGPQEGMNAKLMSVIRAGRGRTQLTEITGRNADLAEVYRMKETFRDLYRQPDLASARGFLKGWIAVAKQSKLKPLVKAAGTINNRAKGILQWYVSRLTNAVMEGLNRFLVA